MLAMTRVSDVPLPAETQEQDAAWLARFHAADPEVMRAVYATHVDSILGAVGGLVTGPDRENVVHDVFSRLLSSEEMRRSFTGGSLSAWLRQVAKNRAIDHLRKQKRRREQDLEAVAEPASEHGTPAESTERQLAQRLVERLREHCVPEKWRAVFEARFVRQESQRDAAKGLGISRTTLMYQEARLRAGILKYLKKTDPGLFDE